MKHLTFAVLILFVFSSACKKSSTDSNANQYLRDKSIWEIKATVLGNWRIHYSFGGITGNTKTNLSNSFLNVKRNDSVYFTLNGMLMASGVATFQRVNTSFGFSAVRMDFSTLTGSPYPWIVDRKIGDTLVVSDDYPNGLGYYMTMIP